MPKISEPLYAAFRTVYHSFNGTIWTQGIINDPQNNKTIYNSSKFIWDTGAQKSCINNQIVEKLHLLKVSKIQTRTASEIHESFSYFVNITLPNNVLIKDFLVTGLPLGEETDVLIGMDIVSQGSLSFSYDYTLKKFVFQFSMPPLPRLDNFVEKGKKRNEKNIKILKKSGLFKK